jgi:hypothetical protein
MAGEVMAKQIQPTSLILIVAAVLFVAARWAYKQGTGGAM